MLTYEEQDVAADALINFVLTVGDPRLALAAGLDDSLLAVLPAGSPLATVYQALRLCMNDGYRLSPPAIVRLLRLVEARDPRVTPFIERIGRTPAAAAAHDAFSDVVLFSKLPFLERTRTREALRLLLEMKPLRPFVVVNGLGGLGKTYTKEFISHIMIGQGALSHCVVQAPPKGGAAVGPLQLARDLAVAMGGRRADEPPAQTDADQWYRELVNWVVDAGIASDLRWWIVLDGFRGDQLRPDTRAFIGKLAARLTNAIPQLRFRLILLDFDHTSLPVTPGLVFLDMVEPISKASVAAFLERLFARAAQVSHNDVFAEITHDLADPIDDLQELGLRLADVLQMAGAGP